MKLFLLIFCLVITNLSFAQCKIFVNSKDIESTTFEYSDFRKNSVIVHGCFKSANKGCKYKITSISFILSRRSYPNPAPNVPPNVTSQETLTRQKKDYEKSYYGEHVIKNASAIFSKEGDFEFNLYDYIDKVDLFYTDISFKIDKVTANKSACTDWINDHVIYRSMQVNLTMSQEPGPVSGKGGPIIPRFDNPKPTKSEYHK